MKRIKILLAVLGLFSISFPVFSADNVDDNQAINNTDKNAKSNEKFEKGCDADRPVKDRNGKCFSCDDVYLNDHPEIYRGKGICKERKSLEISSRKKADSIKENNQKALDGKNSNNCPKDKPAMDENGVCCSCSDNKIKSKAKLYKDVCPETLTNGADRINSRNTKIDDEDKVKPINSRDINTDSGE